MPRSMQRQTQGPRTAMPSIAFVAAEPSRAAALLVADFQAMKAALADPIKSIRADYGDVYFTEREKK